MISKHYKYQTAEHFWSVFNRKANEIQKLKARKLEFKVIRIFK